MISENQGGAPSIGRAVLRVALALALVYVGLGLGLTYWQVVEAQRLATDPGNPLVVEATRTEPRGRILDARGVVLADNVRGPDGSVLRRYPQPVTAPVTGYRSLFFGTSGLERTYDSELVGLSQGNPADEVLRKFRSDPYDPTDITLSIELRLQRRAADLLEGMRGAVVAIEPATGRVVALVSNPTFDPNRLIDPDRGQAYLQALQGLPEDRSPLLNRATQGRFTPGSVFKIVTAIAGLGSGTIEPETIFPDQPEEAERGFRVQGFTIRDAHRLAVDRPPLDLFSGTEISSNIYYAHVGLETGSAAFADWAARLGFGQPIPFDLPTAPSQVTGGRGNEPGGFRDLVELANAAYGQAETYVTPLQMSLVAAAVANDGVLMRPKLVTAMRSRRGVERRVDPEAWTRVLSPEDAGAIQRAMQLAVEGELGARFAGGAKVPGVPTAGKSGTAELGGRGEPHSWFIGFAPVDAPRIAVAVIAEQAGRGAEVAVPIGGELMEYWLGLDR